MTSRTIGRLLLVALAVVGPAFTVSLVSAHGNETTTDDAPPYDGTIADWAGEMETHRPNTGARVLSSGWNRTWA